MKKINMTFDKYTMRLIEVDDIDDYYTYAFENASEEVNYYTGTLERYTKKQIESYVHSIVKDETRYDFILLSDGIIIGELVLNELIGTSCNYRICLYDRGHYSKGIGYKATLKAFDFAFRDLKIKRITLEVYPFNTRAIGLYRKIGFKVVNEVFDHEAKEPYQKIIRMDLLVQDFNLNNL